MSARRQDELYFTVYYSILSQFLNWRKVIYYSTIYQKKNKLTCWITAKLSPASSLTTLTAAKSPLLQSIELFSILSHTFINGSTPILSLFHWICSLIYRYPFISLFLCYILDLDLPFYLSTSSMRMDGLVLSREYSLSLQGNNQHFSISSSFLSQDSIFSLTNPYRERAR